MDRIDLTGSLAFGTIGVVLLVLIVLLVRFMRKPQNQHPMDGQPERNIAEINANAGEVDLSPQNRRIP